MGLKATDPILAKLGDDEPIFILRAQDLLAPIVVNYWIMLASRNGVAETKIEEARKLEDSMYRWQRADNTKIPD